MASMRNLTVFLVVLCLNIIHISESEIFTAIVQLERILQSESIIAADLRSYIAEEEGRLQSLKDIASDYEAHSSEGLLDPEKYLGNPINSFLLVKRFTIDWDRVEALIRNNTSELFLGAISQIRNNFPDEEDLVGSANGLLRLQDTYALPTEKLARGEIQGLVTSPVLSDSDCFDLGRIAYNSGDYYHTVLWMKEAYDLSMVNPISDISIPVLLDYLSYAVFSQGNNLHALELTKELLSLQPDHVRAQNNKKYYEQLLADEAEGQNKGDAGNFENIKNPRDLDAYRQSDEFARYEGLCRGEDIIPYARAHELTCQYVRPHPYFILRPLKQMTHYFKPDIYTYVDIMTESEADAIKRIANPRLKRATVQNPQTGNLETAYYRVSKSAWLRDSEDPLIARVSQKVTKITGLSICTAEEFQVVNYGIAGHYEPHFDFARKNEIKGFDPVMGNRIATTIFYLSDVPAGGATVFPHIGVKLWPAMGSMAFWLNLKKNGDGDYDTRHAGCPVLVGSKWISNKWLHERGQERSHPCTLNPED